MIAKINNSIKPINNSIKPLKIPRAREIYGTEGYMYSLWQINQLQYYGIEYPSWKRLKQLDRQQPIPYRNKKSNNKNIIK